MSITILRSLSGKGFTWKLLVAGKVLASGFAKSHTEASMVATDTFYSLAA